MQASDFLDIVRLQGNETMSFRLGTIDAGYSSGRPQVVFDGENMTSLRTWPYLSSYTPVAGDRVLVAVVGHGGVVLGAIV